MAALEPGKTQLAALREGSEAFHARFVRAGALALGGVALLVVVLGIATRSASGIITGTVTLGIYGLAYALASGERAALGRRIFVYGFLLGALGSSFTNNRGQFAPYALVAVVGTTLAGFTLTRADLAASLVLGVATVALVVAQHILRTGADPQFVVSGVVTLALLFVEALAIILFTRHARANQQKLHGYVEEVDRVMVHAQRIAKGDLGGTVEGDSEVSETIRAMLEGLRTMVTRTREAAAALSSSAQEIAAMARQQEQGAVEQASAVAQVHKTLARLLEGSSFAAQSTEEVFRNVELTQKTSEVVAQRASALSAHTRRISALLEVIKSIANKSEILALNAALEGARAGEAGRGFSLVASQMQRLAESVMDSVRDVRALVEDIEAATSATLLATEESTSLSAKATSAARQISVTLQQQRGSTEQVSAAMQDIQQVTAQVSAGSTQSLSATRDLTRLADELKRAIERFRV